MLPILNIVTQSAFITSACRSTLLLTATAATGLLTSHLFQLAAMSSASTSTYEPGKSSIVYVTTPNDESAKKIARALVTQKLAACVNILPGIQSIYQWEGRVNEDSEYLLMIKTVTDKVDAVSQFVRENHPYSVAEVISVKIENGNPPYLDWIEHSVKL